MALARGSSAGALPKGARPAVHVGAEELLAGLLCRTGRGARDPQCSLELPAARSGRRAGAPRGKNRPQGLRLRRKRFRCHLCFRNVARGLGGTKRRFPAPLVDEGFNAGIGPWGGGGRKQWDGPGLLEDRHLSSETVGAVIYVKHLLPGRNLRVPGLGSKASHPTSQSTMAL